MPVNNITLTFTETTTSHTIDIMTLQDDDYDADGEFKVICLRIIDLVEPCPNYVSIGNAIRVPIQDDDSKLPTYVCMYV